MIQNAGEPLRLTVDDTVQQLGRAYASLISAEVPLKKFPSVMLWGPPGVGKSQGVRQIGRYIQEKTGKSVAATDVRLLLFNPVDLRGIPTANADKTLAVWLRPKIFQMDDRDNVVNILLLDEISAAPQSVQAAAYQITLDRRIGEHVLPENCIVIAAGNRVTDRSVAYTMPKALANRLCHIEVVGDLDSWLRWAVHSGVNGLVTGFLRCNPSLLMDFQPASDALAFPTPRAWEMVSNILTHVSENVAEVLPLIAGCVGERAAYEFQTWSEVRNRIPTMESVFSGETASVPTRPEALYALGSQLAFHARHHHTKPELANLMTYAQRLPAEFRTRLFEDLLEVESLRRALYNNRVFDDWFARSGRDWGDYGIND